MVVGHLGLSDSQGLFQERPHPHFRPNGLHLPVFCSSLVSLVCDLCPGGTEGRGWSKAKGMPKITFLLAH